MKAIYKIKKFSADEQSFNLLNNAALQLIRDGASVIILGCTEIPLALSKEKCNFELVDPMEILAKSVIERTLMSKKLWNSRFLPTLPIITSSSGFSNEINI